MKRSCIKVTTYLHSNFLQSHLNTKRRRKTWNSWNLYWDWWFCSVYENNRHQYWSNSYLVAFQAIICKLAAEEVRRTELTARRTQCKSASRVDKPSCERNLSLYNGLTNHVIEHNLDYDNIVVRWHTGTKDSELYDVVEDSKLDYGVEAVAADMAGRDSSGNLPIAGFNYRPPALITELRRERQ